MALPSCCVFPASGYTNHLQGLNKGPSSRIYYSFAFSSFSSYGGHAQGRHASTMLADTITCQSLHTTTTHIKSATYGATPTVHTESSVAELGEAFKFPATHYLKRALIACTLAGLLTSGCIHCDKLPLFLQHILGPGVAHASLVQMPPESLNNRYFLVRSGESEFEKIGVINTNPVTKTNVESGLSDVGKKQAVKAALQLKEMGACDGSCWIWPSITQRAYQAAEIIAYINNINHSRIVPEYSFLDARGLGAYEGKSLSYISKVYEVDAESPQLRPPSYTDGTPNESVVDVLVRVTQLMSILETQYFGENIIIVAPDSDNLSVLQAALTGLDLRRHSGLAFVPGEVRYVDLDSRPPQRITRQSGLLKCDNASQCG